MPRTCTICAHPKRHEIDAAIVSGALSNRAIARQNGLAKDAVRRHAVSHLAELLAEACARADAARGDDLLAKVRALEADARAILDEARGSGGNPDRALRAIDRLARLVELLAKLRGELRDGAQVNVLVLPEWAALRARILDALEPHPEARLAVARALQEAPP